MNIAQVLCAAGPVDAVTNQALAWRAEFRRWGWQGEDFSASMEPQLRRQLRPLHELDPDSADVVLVHYSGYARRLERVFEGRAHTVLVSHNVTPAQWFWPYEPVEGARCTLGRDQLEGLARRADALAAVSAFNARELTEMSDREAEVIPILFDRGRLGSPAVEGGASPAVGGGASGDLDEGGPEIMFVGRLAPHKRQDLVIAAFAALRRRRPGARLRLIGTPLSPSYGRQLSQLADVAAPDGVRFETQVPLQGLIDAYRAADVFLCLSEHEGFCIPLLEAFHFGVPVVARDAGAVGEVVDGAGVLLSPEDQVPTIAALLDLLVGDPELREELRRRGERRLQDYDYARTADRMKGLLERVAAA